MEKENDYLPVKRYIAVFVAFLSIMAILVIRIFYFQVIKGRSLAQSASVQRMKTSGIEKPRGDIIDRNGIRLTNRNEKYLIVLKPIYLKHNTSGLESVCSILNVKYNSLKTRIESEKEPIVKVIDEETANKIMKLEVKGISIINSLKRYDEYSVARHITGYLNSIDRTGAFGMEKFYEEVLSNEGESIIGMITDAMNNPLEGIGYRIIKYPDEKGLLDVKLTIDYHIQKITEEVMNERNISGAVVVEDVCSGDIVAMASKPDFLQDNVENYLNGDRNELFNRAVASYNLGSVFKIIDVAVFFSENQNFDENYYCKGYIEVDGKIFKCPSYKKGGHGSINLREAFALSCNPFFIDRALQSGYKSLIVMAKKFGLGETTGIDMQGVPESPGNLPDENEYYSQGDIANISIGQGEIMATPLQVADIVATIANGGIRNKIHMVDSIVDDDGNKVRELRHEGWERIISKEVADRIKELMEGVTTEGTGMEAELEQYGGAAGKTGSAETGDKNVVHAWFAGYFPCKTPKYSIAVFVENGKSGGHTAAPVFAEIAKRIMQKGL